MDVGDIVRFDDCPSTDGEITEASALFVKKEDVESDEKRKSTTSENEEIC